MHPADSLNAGADHFPVVDSLAFASLHSPKDRDYRSQTPLEAHVNWEAEIGMQDTPRCVSQNANQERAYSGSLGLGVWAPGLKLITTPRCVYIDVPLPAACQLALVRSILGQTFSTQTTYPASSHHEVQHGLGTARWSRLRCPCRGGDR